MSVRLRPVRLRPVRLRPVRLRRRPAPLLLAVVGLLAVVAPACTPGPPTTVPVAGFTAPGATLSVSLPPVDVTFLGCTGRFTPPTAGVTGPAIVVPDFEYQVGAGTQTIPGIRLLASSATASVGSFRLSCRLPFPILPIDVTTPVSAAISTGATTAVGTWNEGARTITLTGVRLSVTATLDFQNFGYFKLPVTPFEIPLPPITLPV